MKVSEELYLGVNSFFNLLVWVHILREVSSVDHFKVVRYVGSLSTVLLYGADLIKVLKGTLNYDYALLEVIVYILLL